MGSRSGRGQGGRGGGRPRRRPGSFSGRCPGTYPRLDAHTRAPVCSRTRVRGCTAARSWLGSKRSCSLEAWIRTLAVRSVRVSAPSCVSISLPALSKYTPIHAQVCGEKPRAGTVQASIVLNATLMACMIATPMRKFHTATESRARAIRVAASDAHRCRRRSRRPSLIPGCAYTSTQEGGASHDGFGVLVSSTFPLFPNHKFAHDLPHPSWVHIKVHLRSRARVIPSD